MKKYAVLAVLLVAILATTAYAQPERVPVTVDNPTPQTAPATAGSVNSQPTGWQKAETPAPAPVATAPSAPAFKPVPEQRYATRKQVEDHVLAGDKPTTIVNRNYYPTRVVRTTKVVRETPGHKGAYQHLKTWDPASCSYVDARDSRTLREANAYTDGAIASTVHAAAPASHPHNWGWLQWLLLVLLLALLYLLLWRYYDTILGWLTHRSTPSAPEPDLANTLTGRQFGRSLGGPARTEAYNDGRSNVEMKKGLKNLDRPNAPEKWAPLGQQVRIEFTPPEAIGVTLYFRNLGLRRRPLRPGELTFRDSLEGGRPARGTGWLFVGDQCMGKIDDAMMAEITSGQEFDLLRLITALPASTEANKGAVNINYQVDTTPAGWQSGGRPEGAVAPGGEDQAQPAPPTSLFTLPDEPAAAVVAAAPAQAGQGLDPDAV